MPPELVVRADAGPITGVGHVMRCLALAHAWRALGGPVTFVTACEDAPLRERVATVGRVIDVRHVHPDPRDADSLTALVAAIPGARVVVDGYHFDAAYQQRAREVARCLLVVDDIGHLPSYSADLILNQNIRARDVPYPGDARLLLGPTYAMLRPEFAPFVRQARATPVRARRVLVTFGGGDSTAVTSTACQALAALDDPELQARVLLGAHATRSELLRDLAPSSKTRVELLGPTAEMPALMAWADVAVSAGGSTCWELAASAVPSIAVTLADNQRANVHGLAAIGAVLDGGEGHALTPGSLASLLRDLMGDQARREAMGQRGRELVDGRGAERVADALCEWKAEARAR